MRQDLWFSNKPGNRHLRLRHRDDIRCSLARPGTERILRGGFSFAMMMGLNSVGMDQYAAGTHHNQHRINRYRTCSDGDAIEYPTEAFHLIQPLSIPIAVSHLALRIFGCLVHESPCAVYLQILMLATVVTSCESGLPHHFHRPSDPLPAQALNPTSR